jgi:hypothetical protein
MFHYAGNALSHTAQAKWPFRMTLSWPQVGNAEDNPYA